MYTYIYIYREREMYVCNPEHRVAFVGPADCNHCSCSDKLFRIMC